MIFRFLGYSIVCRKKIIVRSFDNCREQNFAKGERRCWIRQLLLIVTGPSYGLLSAAGVFTVLVAVG